MIRNGIDNLVQHDAIFKKKRLGLITAPTGLNLSFEPTYRLLHRDYHLAALFAPEHGVRGDLAAGAIVDSCPDPQTGVPVYSLYRGDSKRLTPEMLEQVDLVVYDIQDVGVRYYTFIYTMLYALEDCARAGKTFVVLDRINPLNGLTVEGNVLTEGYKSFVGGYPLAIRYGLTAGELAVMANAEMGWNADLHIVRCDGWNRGMQFPDTGMVWVPPSLNIPHFESALLYPGTCLFEGTNLSEGRGTASPFEVVGAPFLRDPDRVAAELNQLGLAGVRFRPTWFRPTTSKHAGDLCGGVQIHVTDSRALSSVEIGVRMLYTIRDHCAEFAFLPPVKENGRPFIDLLGGDRIFREEAVDIEAMLETFREESRVFAKRKAQYHLY